MGYYYSSDKDIRFSHTPMDSNCYTINHVTESGENQGFMYNNRLPNMLQPWKISHKAKLYSAKTNEP